MGAPMPVPVFAAVGVGAWGPVQELRARPEVRLVSTPRHASVLLVAGEIASDHAEALDRVHDQLPHPRRTVAWSGAGDHPLAATVVTGSADELVDELVEAHKAVTTDRSLSEPDRLPDEEPNEWRGVGPHGQGGEGMMGGTPYGRPMAMTGDDRDGLALDQLEVPLGPFLEVLPPGVILQVTLQGEVLQRAEVQRPEPTVAIGAPIDDHLPPGTEAQARHGLRWLSHALHVHGLDGHASRAAALSITPADAARDRRFTSLRRSIRRSGLLWALRRVGDLDGWGDASDRWSVRLDEIQAALCGEEARVETAQLSLEEVAGDLVGLTLTDAVTTIVSLGPADQPVDRGARL